MFNLVLKDVLIQKKNFILAIIVYPLIAFIAFSSMPEGMLAMSIFSIAYIMISGAFSYDERTKADIFINSLPVKKNDVVMARYISLIIFVILGALITLVYSRILIFFGIAVEAASLVSPVKILPVSLITIIIFCIQMPFMFKYGYIKTRTISFVLYIGFVALLSAISGIIAEVSSFAEDAQKINNIPILIMFAFVLLSVSIAVFISKTISVSLYTKKEF